MTTNDQQHQEPCLPYYLSRNSDNGREAVQFIIDYMQGKVDDAKPIRRIGSANTLADIDPGPKPIDRSRRTHSPKQPESVPQPQTPRTHHPTPVNTIDQAERAIYDAALEQLRGHVKELTQHGLLISNFYLSAMRGEYPDFTEYHRYLAAEQVVARYLPLPPQPSVAQPSDPLHVSSARETISRKLKTASQHIEKDPTQQPSPVRPACPPWRDPDPSRRVEGRSNRSNPPSPRRTPRKTPLQLEVLGQRQPAASTRAMEHLAPRGRQRIRQDPHRSRVGQTARRVG